MSIIRFIYEVTSTLLALGMLGSDLETSRPGSPADFHDRYTLLETLLVVDRR